MALNCQAPPLGQKVLPFIRDTGDTFTSTGGVAMHVDDLQPMDVFPVDKDSGKSTKDTHITEYDAMLPWVKANGTEAVKAGVLWSTLAMEITPSDSAEHNLACAQIYKMLQSEKIIAKVSGNEEATLGDVTIKAQKKMVELIDSLASLPQPQRLVMEASGKLDKLRDITRQYSLSQVEALKYIEEHNFFSKWTCRVLSIRI